MVADSPERLDAITDLFALKAGVEDGEFTVNALDAARWAQVFDAADVPMVMLTPEDVMDYKFGLLRNARHLGKVLYGHRYSFCERTLRVVPEKTTSTPLHLAWDSTLAPRPRQPTPIIDGPRVSRWQSGSQTYSPRFSTRPRFRS